VFNDGDGVDGFSRAFYMKGSQQTLSTFWDLDDRSSHDILENFYSKLSKGFGSNRSLRESQIDYILSAKNSSQAAPYYWAGHQMNGSTQRFEPNQSGRGGDGAIFWMALLCFGGLGYFISFRIR
jgi:CHAT domain-containing protein